MSVLKVVATMETPTSHQEESFSRARRKPRPIQASTPMVQGTMKQMASTWSRFSSRTQGRISFTWFSQNGLMRGSTSGERCR